MKLSANQSRLLKLVPAVALGGVIAVSTLFCFVDATGVATSRGEKAARSARLFWNVEQAYHSLHGAYFGEGDLGPAESPNALAVMTGASWQAVRLAELATDRSWAMVFVAESPPHYVAMGGGDLTLYRVDSVSAPPPAELPGQTWPLEEWTEVFTETPIPLFNRARQGEAPVQGGRSGRKPGGER